LAERGAEESEGPNLMEVRGLFEGEILGMGVTWRIVQRPNKRSSSTQVNQTFVMKEIFTGKSGVHALCR